MTAYSNDPTIGDGEALLRGLLPEHMEDAPDGAVLYAAFMPRHNEDHLSVFRESSCEPMRLFKKTMWRSKALGRLFAGPVRRLAPAVAGIGRDAKQSECHVLILRQEGFKAKEIRWIATAQRLAALCAISHLNPKHHSGET
jgi:hypothetical protein